MSNEERALVAELMMDVMDFEHELEEAERTFEDMLDIGDKYYLMED